MAKIGRNAPCPCGSGLKYKKCCLDKARTASRAAESLVTAAAQPEAESPVIAAKRPEAESPVIAAERPEAESPVIAGAQPEAERSEPAAAAAMPALEAIQLEAEQSMTWHQAQDQALALELIGKLSGDYRPEQIRETIAFWHAFSTAVRPAYRKPGAYCAALELYIAEQNGHALTKAEAADKHQISASTVAKKYAELQEFAAARQRELVHA